MNQIFTRKILPVTVIPSAELAVPLARALLAGGLDVIEVTFRTEDAPRRDRGHSPRSSGNVCRSGNATQPAAGAASD